ncbi:MAG TPA: hypothetical protein PKZ59_04995, partial [Candidatus Hydrogenedentes bacterium]|nr:hypothetical protein [Candidatus Hydrogenedentota bacterium]
MYLQRPRRTEPPEGAERTDGVENPLGALGMERVLIDGEEKPRGALGAGAERTDGAGAILG